MLRHTLQRYTAFDAETKCSVTVCSHRTVQIKHCNKLLGHDFPHLGVYESTSNLQFSDGNFLPWRLVVTSSSATRIHGSLLRAVGCRSCLGVILGEVSVASSV